MISWKMRIRNLRSGKQLCKIFCFFVEKFEGHDNGEGHDTNSREQQENTVQTKQQ